MINWLAILIVAGATLLASVTVVVFYSLGLRLYAVSSDGRSTKPWLIRAGSMACFSLCGAAVLFGLYLIIPFSQH